MVDKNPYFSSKDEILAIVNVTYKSRRVRSTYLAYAERLDAQNLPIVLSPEHLSYSLGLEQSALLALAYGTDQFYRTFSIPKAAGGFRRIDAPLTSLKNIQNILLHNIFERLPVHDCVTGYVHNRSILDHVRPHVGQKELLRLDISNFFPSITFYRVSMFLRELGYSERVANTLSKLVTLNRVLPQGSPCSPAISNLLFQRVDKRIAEFCAQAGRYHGAA